MDPFGKTSHCRGLHSSGKNSPHQLSMHIGQPVLASLVLEGQLLVVDAQQMENRRIEVMHMDRVLCNVVAEIIGAAMHMPLLPVSYTHLTLPTKRIV